MLVIPLVSLVVLWAFAAQSVANQAIDQRHIDTANKIYGNAVQPMLITLAQERQESVVWIAAHGRQPRTAMDAVRQRMDGTIVQMNKAAKSGSFQNTLTPLMRQRLATLIDKLNRINTVRGQVDSGAFNKLAAFNAYNDVLDSHFRFIYLLVAENGYQQAYHLTGMSRAMELAGREAALVGGVLVSGGRMSTDERAAIAKLVYERRYLEESSLSEFNEANGAPYKEALGSPAVKNFVAVEDKVLSVPTKSRLKMNPATWQTGVGGYLQAMDGALSKSRVTLAADAKKTSDDTLLRLALIGGIGLAAILLTALLMLRFGRRIVRELRGLQTAAHDLADQRLPDVVTRLKRGDDVDVAVEAPSLTVGRSAEVESVAEAFSTVQRTAIEAAVGQANLRKAVNGVFQNLARRNQSLLHRQLSMLDTLERKAGDPDDLADLFAIDHLTTRMRRHAEGLIILAGATPGRSWRNPVGILDALRGAIGEIEDYARVEVVSDAEEGIDGAAVADVIHLLAELIENAVTFSPPNTPVEVDAGMVGRGFVVEIQDRGLGVSPDKLAALNERLSREPEFDLSGGEQLGLLVVGTLAHRNGIKVVLEPNSYGGLKTIVLLPHSIVVSADRIGRPDEPSEAPAAPAPAPAPAPAAPEQTSADTAGWVEVAPTGRLTPATTGCIGGWGDGSEEHGTAGVGGPYAGAHAAPQSSAQEARPLGVHESQPSGAHAAPQTGAGGSGAYPAGPSGDAGTHAGMPRRVRRASLAPQLRDAEPPEPAAAPQDDPGRDARSPERARSVMASMQSGWRRGRAEPAQRPEPPAGWNDDEVER